MLYKFSVVSVLACKCLLCFPVGYSRFYFLCCFIYQNFINVQKITKFTMWSLNMYTYMNIKFNFQKNSIDLNSGEDVGINKFE